MKKKKLYKRLAICLIIFILGLNVPYKYDNNAAVDYVTANANGKSKCQCAWYVMKAIHRGGCYPCGIYPAYAYSDRLISMGFEKVPAANYKPEKGDIVVLTQNSKSVFGHIAMYNGSKWVSDYLQKNGLYPNQTYRQESSCKYFRQTDGWHFANIWFSPVKLVEYVVVFIKGFNKINY